MKQSASYPGLLVAALLSNVHAQQVPAAPAGGLDEICVDDGVQTIVYEYPVFYSTVYESVGTIFNFLGGTNSLVINNPGQTIITSTVLTTTVVVTSTTTATVTASGSTGVTATLGAGIPSGTVTSIPSTSPFALAFIVDDLAGNRPEGYVSDDSIGAVEDADFFYLEGGELRSIPAESQPVARDLRSRSTGEGRVGRNYSQTYAEIVASEYSNDVTTTFTLVDGALRWNSPDRGVARFYVCPDGLYAGFPDAPINNCNVAIVGAIAKSAVDAELGIDNTTTTSSSASTSTRLSTSGSLSTSSSRGSSTSTSNSSMSSSSTSRSFNGTSTSATSTSSGTGGSSSTTRTTTITMISSSTTSSAPATTTTGGNGGDEGICPGADPEDDYFGYSVYCGYAVDPVNDEDELIPGGEKDVASFDDCTLLCDTTEGCTGLSYFASGTTCYIHGGENREPRSAPGYDGAIKNDADGGSSSSTTTTTRSGGSTSTGNAGSTTTSSGSGSSSTGTTISSTTVSGASTTTSDTDGSTTSAATTTSESGTTTSTSSGTSTTTVADLCPTPSGSVSGGYEIFCGYVVDPEDDLDSINPPSFNVDFQTCLDQCTDNTLCVGLSYIESSTTCYLHKGSNKAAKPQSGWRGAIKVGADSSTTTTTTTTMSEADPDATSTTTSPTTSSTTSEATTSSEPTTTTRTSPEPTTTSISTTSSTTSEEEATTTTTTTTSPEPTTTSTSTTTTTTTTTSDTTTTTTAASNPNPADSPGVKIQCEANCPDETATIENGYQILAGKGINGVDLLSSSVVTDFDACIDLCSDTEGCVSVSFKREGSFCYRHSTCHDAFTSEDDSFDSAERIASSCPRQS